MVINYFIVILKVWPSFLNMLIESVELVVVAWGKPNMKHNLVILLEFFFVNLGILNQVPFFILKNGPRPFDQTGSSHPGCYCRTGWRMGYLLFLSIRYRWLFFISPVSILLSFSSSLSVLFRPLYPYLWAFTIGTSNLPSGSSKAKIGWRLTEQFTRVVNWRRRSSSLSLLVIELLNSISGSLPGA